jgi:hypothetical protein
MKKEIVINLKNWGFGRVSPPRRKKKTIMPPRNIFFINHNLLSIGV